MASKAPAIGWNKLVLISTLYVSQSVPVSFIKTGFQVFLKNQGIPYDSLSQLLGLLLLPWAFKFLWAPLVDRLGWHRAGHRKSWIVPLQVLGALTLVWAAFLNLESDLIQIFTLFMVYSFLCATQDIAVDGLAVLSLSKKQHGIGNSMQMGGYYFGELAGGALILILFENYGWTWSIIALAAFFLLPLIPLLPYREPADPESPERPSLKSIASYFRQEQGLWLLLLLIYMGNQVLARTLLPSILLEKGMKEGEIGWLIGIYGNSASILGAVAGGLWMEKLGRKTSLLSYAVLKIPAFYLLLFLPNAGTSLTTAVILTNDFVAGLATVALFTVMMDKCRLSSPGTDFTVQQSINSVGILLFVVLSGIVKHSMGFSGLIHLAAALGILSILLVFRLKVEQNGVT